MTLQPLIVFAGLCSCLACGSIDGTQPRGDGIGGVESKGSGGIAPETGGVPGNAAGGMPSGGSAASSGGANDEGGGGEQSSGGGVDNTGGASGSGGTTASDGTPSEGFASLLDTRQPKISFYHGVFGATASISLDPQLQSPAADASCSWTFAGDCGYRKGCERKDAQILDAGDVSLSSPDVEGTFSSSYEDGSYAADHSTFATRLSGEEALLLSASGGGDLPPFDIDSQFPLLILVTRPTANTAEPLTVPTTSDVVVEFSRGTANTWLYAAASVGSGSEAREVLCAANGDPGTLTIPGKALQHVGAGTEIDFLTVSVASLRVDGTDVHFWTATAATTEAREFAFKLVTE